jgi:ribokinase
MPGVSSEARGPRGTSSGRAARLPLMNVAVVGHVEWVEFLRVARIPRRGEIIHASEAWVEPAGGGAVAAVTLAGLAGTATLFTALGSDGVGQRVLTELRALGVRVEAAIRDEPQRRAITYLEDDGERTITVIGDRTVPSARDSLPWEELAECDAVYFTGGDAAALCAARRANVLVATPRALGTLRAAGVELDALVGSGSDAGEQILPGEIQPAPRLVVRTAGTKGGTYTTAAGASGSFPAAPLMAPLVDTYGAGDCFAAGLTFALGERRPLAHALDFAARCAALALTRRGAYGATSRPAA